MTPHEEQINLSEGQRVGWAGLALAAGCFILAVVWSTGERIARKVLQPFRRRIKD